MTHACKPGRTPLHQMVRVGLASGEVIWTTALNVSVAGMALLLPSAPAPGSSLFLRLSTRTKGQGGRTLRLKAEVVHVQAQRERWIVESRFVDLPPEDQAALHNFIAHRRAQLASLYGG